MLGSAELTSRPPRHMTFGRTHWAWKGGDGGERGRGRGEEGEALWLRGC